jgi:hypothetical protein
MWRDVQPRFPVDGEVKFTLAPPGVFGSGDLTDSLVLEGVHVSLAQERNTGKYIRTVSQRMDPISVSSRVGNVSMQAKGNVVTVESHFKSLSELSNLIESVHFGLPVILALKFRDTPIISAVTGTVGGVDFTWAYAEYVWPWQVSTKETQERNFLESWERLELILPRENAQLFAALHYFHVACRLAIVGFTPWEFLGEVLLNLCKVLEALFPPTIEGQGTIDAARNGLRNLKYTDDEIEKWYARVMHLRNQLDVGHVSLVALDYEQLRPVHEYAAHAEGRFRDMLLRVVNAIVAGKLVLQPYQHKRKRDLERTLGRLAQDFPPGGSGSVPSGGSMAPSIGVAVISLKATQANPVQAPRRPNIQGKPNIQVQRRRRRRKRGGRG